MQPSTAEKSSYESVSLRDREGFGAYQTYSAALIALMG